MLGHNVSFPYSPTYSIILPFEANFPRDEWRQWMSQYWSIIIYFGSLYLALIILGRRYMESRPRYELRYALAAWNAFLAIFSIMGTVRTTPEFFHVLWKYGFHFSVCNRSYADYNPISGFWGWLFVMSKLPEFLDTAFIVLRKQKLIFLHWYHHIVTAVFLWYGYTDHSSTARWVMVMNYSVHSLMYSYFAFRALQFRIPRFISIFITIFQITQMMAGTYVAYYVYTTLGEGTPCDITQELINISIGIYGSYFVLFANFFYRTYIQKAKTSKQLSGSGSSRWGSFPHKNVKYICELMVRPANTYTDDEAKLRDKKKSFIDKLLNKFFLNTQNMGDISVNQGLLDEDKNGKMKKE